MSASVVSKFRHFNISSFLFLRALSSRIGFNTPRPSFPLLTSPGTRAGAERDKREVGRIVNLRWHAQAFFRILTGEWYCASTKGQLFKIIIAVVGITFLSALCVAAPKSRCPCCVAVHPRVRIDGRCTLHFFTVLLWRKDRLKRPSPFVLR